ncbi:hypothetical protein SRB5_26930 [Streptomyces sp. RB5]|uniref:YCII-related domain-containing protein n=1 Tax=Streptomyces smaragdinus TaxID=2585196 RepID=A0A7K0CGI7_9ACTN|nr:YciI family protein [Streptomyces smaragdinus]MQY12558.1 hypothetical protein [Streptomyces smaragdinus]
MKYVMLIHGDEAAWEAMDDQQKKEAYAARGEWLTRWREQGKVESGGAELDTPRKAKTLAPDKDGLPVVTDGPYLELKEVIGGFIILRADDIDDAVNVAAGWPGIREGWETVEVRPTVQ